MRHKNILVLIFIGLLLLLALVYFIYNISYTKSQTGAAETSTQLSNKNQVSNKPPEKQPALNKVKSTALDLSPKTKTNGIRTAEFLAEIKNPVYSEDPVIEVTSLQNDFRACEFSLRKLTGEMDEKPELAEFMEELKAQCEAYAEKYPLLYKHKNQYEFISSLPTNSLFGERFKYLMAGFYGMHNDLTFDELNQAQFELSLQLKNPSLISFGTLTVAIGLLAEVEGTAFFMELLQTHDNLWVYEAHNFALQLLACDLPNSQSCAATSYFMVLRCDRETTACGLTFQQWFKSYSTPGMKKDVEIIKNYYRAKYW